MKLNPYLMALLFVVPFSNAIGAYTASSIAAPQFLTLNTTGESIKITWTITNTGTPVTGAYLKMPTTLPIEYAGNTYAAPIVSIAQGTTCALSSASKGTFATGASCQVVMNVKPTHLGTLHFAGIQGVNDQGVTLGIANPGTIKIVPTQAFYFGDSLSDVGNEFTGNTFIGGLWVNFMATDLNLPTVMPARLGGTDYAYGGAETGHQTTVLGVTDQIPVILKNFNNKLDPNALYFIWAGGNDLGVFKAPPFPSPTTTAATMVSNIQSAVTSLQAAGAQNIVLLNLMTIYGPGLLTPPSSINGLTYPNCYLYAGYVYNQALLTAITKLNTSKANMPNYIPITIFDYGSSYFSLVKNPAKNGFIDVIDFCKSYPTSCTAVNQAANSVLPFLNAPPGTNVNAPVVGWYFWDGHPTSAGHAYIEVNLRNYLYPIIY